MGGRVERAIGPNQSACADCDQAGIEESAVEVDVYAFTDPVGKIICGVRYFHEMSYLRLVP